LVLSLLLEPAVAAYASAHLRVTVNADWTTHNFASMPALFVTSLASTARWAFAPDLMIVPGSDQLNVSLTSAAVYVAVPSFTDQFCLKKLTC
jgi:hypothetical protein